MRIIAERNMLLRAKTALPDGLKLATDEFREGWEFVRTFDARRLEKQIVLRGWNFIKIADESLRSGVGETSQEAIASALRLALLRMDAQFNAVEVEYIECSEYPWFFMARLRVCQYRIQQGAEPAGLDQLAPHSIASGRRRLPPDAKALYPDFGSRMPLIKQLLTSPRMTQTGPQ